ncbi:MAG: radical SAM protein, partial [Candidatus Bathycorpusculaceae bacterium]
MLGSHVTVYYELTTECPCNCNHCYIPEALRHDYPLTRSSADVMLDLLILKEKLNVENVVLSGGEPTLHSDFKEIVSFASRLGLKVAVISNGAKPEILKEVSDKAKVWVSLDFYGQTQNRWRHFKGLWQNYKSIADIANIRATLMQNNLEHVEKLIAEAISHNKEITIVPYKGSTSKLMPTPEQLEKLLIYIFEQGYAKEAVVDAPP